MPEQQLQAKGGWLGMNTVGSAHFKRVLELHRPFSKYLNKTFNIGDKNFTGIAHLHGERRIANIR